MAVEDNKLKHRLVGATILVALGVVLLPMWLDTRPGPGSRLEGTVIPEPPKWTFFTSEDKEKAAQLPSPAPSELPADGSANTPPSEQGPPPTETLAEAQGGVWDLDVRRGATLRGLFESAGLGTEQLQAAMKASRSLEHLPVGSHLWLRTGQDNTLQEIIGYGADNKPFLHLQRQNRYLQIVDNASAAQTLAAFRKSQSRVAQLPPSSPAPSRSPAIRLPDKAPDRPPEGETRHRENRPTRLLDKPVFDTTPSNKQERQERQEKFEKPEKPLLTEKLPERPAKPGAKPAPPLALLQEHPVSEPPAHREPPPPPVVVNRVPPAKPVSPPKPVDLPRVVDRPIPVPPTTSPVVERPTPAVERPPVPIEGRRESPAPVIHSPRSGERPTPDNRPVIEAPPMVPTTARMPPPLRPQPPPSPPARDSGNTWVVQLASLNRQENAFALKDSLRSKGFPAFVESIQTPSGKLWRVRVGPEISRGEADAMRSRLENDAHQSGQTVPYP